MKKIVLLTAILLLTTGCERIQLNLLGKRELEKRPEEIEIVTRIEKTDRVRFKYPQIKGLGNKILQGKINETLKGKIYDFKDDYDKDINGQNEDNKKYYKAGYETAYHKNNILSIVYYLEVYEYGAAHPNEFLDSVTLNMQTGKRYTFEDIFQTDSHYETILNERIRNTIQMEEIPVHREFEGIEKNQDYYLSDKGMTIYYQPYQYTSYAYGPLTFFIAYGELENCLNTHVVREP